MKYGFFIFLFVGLTLCCTAQKKNAKVYPIDELSASYEVTAGFHDLRETYHEIYLGSADWIFSLAFKSREDLPSLIKLKYPATKFYLYGLAKRNGNKSLTDSLDVLFSDIYKQVELANEVMQILDTWEKYDSAPTWDSAKKIFRNEMVPLNKKIELRLNRMINTYKAQLKALLISPSVSQQKEIPLDKIKKLIETDYSFYDAKEYIWAIYKDTNAWLFHSDDTSSKEELKAIYADSIHLQASFSSGTDEPSMIHLLQHPYLKELVDTLIADSKEITRDLTTEANYDDALIVLLAEDELDGQLRPHYDSLRSLFNEVQENRQSELMILLANPNEAKSIKKRKDIVKILESNPSAYTMMLNLLKEKSKSEGNMKAYNALDQVKVKELIAKLVPVYDRIFTHEEIKEILKFQTSKTGKKLQDKSLMISLEMVQIITDYLNGLIENVK